MEANKLCDPAEIERAVRLIVGSGVTELRALNASTNGRWPKTHSGYFDDPAKLAAAAKTLKTASGIYFVPNVVNPDLLARSANRIQESGRGSATQDSDITRRVWLLIDCDAQRPSGISANDAEHEAALKRCDAIVLYLRSLGWPDPIAADSGNGGHLLYSIDLARDDGGLVGNCLKTLAQRFDDAAVHVDTSVANPARIWKLYGTRACKGDSIEDRPHRMSKILSSPETVEIVPDELLQALAAEHTPTQEERPRRKQTTHRSGTKAYDVAAFMANPKFDVADPVPWIGDGGEAQKWIFNKSPMCGHHNEKQHVIQFTSGGISAGCKHLSCGWTWPDLRARYETKARSERQPDYIPEDVRNGTEYAEPEEVEVKDKPWPEIDRYGELDLPVFPVDAMPDTLREWADAESHFTQTPVDLAAMLSLTVVSACIARKLEVEPVPGWIEPTNLYTVTILPPGNRKSAVFTDATRPLRDVERNLIESQKTIVAKEASEWRRAKKQLGKLEDKAASGGNDAAEAGDAATELAIELADWPEPSLPKLILDDCTSEKLGIVLEQQGGRIASMSAEGGIFDLMKGLYSNSGIANFEVYLKGHSGDTITTDRVGRRGVHIERPAVTLGLAVQPEVIEGLSDNSAFRGRGLLARFLYSMPKSWIGNRKRNVKYVPDRVTRSYGDLIHTLHRSCPEMRLGLSSEARHLFEAWQDEIESKLGDFGELGSITDWASKLCGATLRLAAVMHSAESCENIPDRIGQLNMLGAIEIARSRIDHAWGVLHKMKVTDGGDEAEVDAKFILDWVEKHDLATFSRRDIQQKNRKHFPQAADVDRPLTKLEERGYIRRLQICSGSKGGRPSVKYEVNPAAFNRADRNSEKLKTS